MNFGAEIKRRREEAGLTQAELAEFSSKSRRTIQRWESIDNNSWGTLLLIKSALELRARILKKEIS